jgi:signal transduction histidine kinase
LLGVDGSVVAGEGVRRALERGETSGLLDRDEAARFGLPKRVAVVGMARGEVGGDPWGIVTVTSAQTLRDRWRRAELRLMFGGALVGLVVVAFGGRLLRGLRRQLELERRLGGQERDALLAKADKMATLAALGTGIAHEIASPLGVIAARVEQLQGRSGQDERTQRSLRIIAEQVRRIHGVMRGVLALARGESPVMERVEPGAVAEAARRQVQHRFEEGKVALGVRAEAGLPEVTCDPRLIEQALVNVLLNAAGAPGVTTVALRVSQGEKFVRFSVEDDGGGMSPETIQQATRPFFTTKREQGTGLGLAITHEIVKHHQGELVLLSSPGDTRGTRVDICLPIP